MQVIASYLLYTLIKPVHFKSFAWASEGGLCTQQSCLISGETSQMLCFRYNYSYYMGSVLAAIPRGIFAGQSLGDLPKLLAFLFIQYKETHHK